jgi:hypothetical protein
MKWIVFVLCTGSALSALAGAETPVSDRAAAGNAAPIYWQAFAAMPIFTAGEQKSLNDALQGIPPLGGDDVYELVQHCAASLKQMHRAARMRSCDWELDYAEGPNMLIPQLGKGKELGRIALLRAKLRLQKGDINGAEDDIVATLRMARHVSDSTVLISFLVDNAMEKQAIELLAANLPALNHAALDRTAKALSALPVTPSLSECIGAEKATKKKWLDIVLQARNAKKDFKADGSQNPLFSGDDWVNQMRLKLDSISDGDLKAAIARYGRDMGELAQIIDLPTYAERREKANQFFAELSKADPAKVPADKDRLFSTWGLPVYDRMIDVEEQRRMRRELISLAILVQSQGPESLKSSKLPGADKVEYRSTAKGFELHYRLLPGGKEEVFKVGPAER